MSDKECDWPHAVMDRAEECVMTAILEVWRPIIEEIAYEVSGGRRVLAKDLAQEARIILWQWGVVRVGMQPRWYVRTAIEWLLRDIRKSQYRKAGGKRRVLLHTRVV